MSFIQAFQKLMDVGLLTPLALGTFPQPIPLSFRLGLHCSHHRGLGHDINHYTNLCYAIQDLIDSGSVNLG